jgi:hypothetical protein
MSDSEDEAPRPKKRVKRHVYKSEPQRIAEVIHSSNLHNFFFLFNAKLHSAAWEGQLVRESHAHVIMRFVIA